MKKTILGFIGAPSQLYNNVSEYYKPQDETSTSTEAIKPNSKDHADVVDIVQGYKTLHEQEKSKHNALLKKYLALEEEMQKTKEHNYKLVTQLRDNLFQEELKAENYLKLANFAKDEADSYKKSNIGLRILLSSYEKEDNLNRDFCTTLLDIELTQKTKLLEQIIEKQKLLRNIQNNIATYTTLKLEHTAITEKINTFNMQNKNKTQEEINEDYSNLMMELHSNRNHKIKIHYQIIDDIELNAQNNIDLLRNLREDLGHKLDYLKVKPDHYETALSFMHNLKREEQSFLQYKEQAKKDIELFFQQQYEDTYQILEKRIHVNTPIIKNTTQVYTPMTSPELPYDVIPNSLATIPEIQD